MNTSPHNTANDKSDSAWDRAANFEKENRPMLTISKIVIKGSVDVVFVREAAPHLVVAGESPEVIRGIKTRFNGDKLIIEDEVFSITSSGEAIGVHQSAGVNTGVMQVFYGSVGQVAGRSIHVVGSGNIVSGNDMRDADGALVFVRGIVRVALPAAPSIRIKGSGDVTLYDLQQDVLDVGIRGSGNITAFGQVGHLVIKVAGSGDVDVSELVATSADFSIAGSGDIDAYVTHSVKARIAGSGDIVVRGNPTDRDQAVAGSGEIEFQ
ncbi:GIN domain-containing protein [Castellaniella sp.]|uniref:GIN domain-containing protein n=1 Tax=Castellaniella sp. TaxID=1955812 RepID=UPI002AFFED5C|nr:DUF2807 domain-containing protein [Castellaniella sp.]